MTSLPTADKTSLTGKNTVINVCFCTKLHFRFQIRQLSFELLCEAILYKKM